MKKLVSVLSVFALVSIVLLAGACGADKSKTLIIGASPVPHMLILDFIKGDYEQKGFELEVKEFTDYVTPNTAVLDGSIHANFFQHIPYLEARREWDVLTSVLGVHIEPLGLYSVKHKTLEAIPDGATIAVPNDSTNGGRAYLLLQAKELIKLRAGAGLEASDLDVVENPHNYKFRSLEAAQLPRVLDDVDGACINGNYALEAGFNPMKDALIIEGSDSPYVNIVVVKRGFENDPRITALKETLFTPKVREFILNQWSDGSVVPVF
ncbi:MAG: MetQ/NlpA family ABC transporter substrate-binding protein [Spirochaetaceae bacterium]|nr:MetQ/NlpA family ABC transporter substrate-binding protein [Spirochaetaceae bacterium]